jgi:hypothetical protein
MKYEIATTPTGFAMMVAQVGMKLANVSPMMSKFGKRFQDKLRKNLRQGLGATGRKMPPLSQATLNSLVTDTDGKGNWVVLGTRRNMKGGSTPLYATGKMVKKFVFTLTGNNGFVMFVNDPHRMMVSEVNIKDRRWRAKRPEAARKALGAKGIKTTVEGARKGWIIPGRVPFALNSRQVKRSVTELNKYVLEPILRATATKR